MISIPRQFFDQLSRLLLRQSPYNALTAVIVGLVVLGLAGCGKNSTTSNAKVRFLHLAPEISALSVKLNDDEAIWLSGLNYRGITEFKDVEAGSRRFRVLEGNSVLIDQSISASTDKRYTYIVFGGKSTISISSLGDDISSSSSGKTRLRLINFAVGLGSYDLYATTSTEDYRNVEPKVKGTASTTIELDNGSYTIRLTSPNSKDVLFEMAPRNLESQRYYNLGLYNVGSGEIPSAFWWRQDDEAAPELLTNSISRIRAANSESTIATVNVSLSGTRVFTNVPFGGVSAYARTSSGSKSITYTNPTNAAQTYSFTDTLEGARDYSTILSTDANGAVSIFRLADSFFPPSSGKARVRLVNASTVPDLSLALSFTAVTPTIPIRAASSYVEVTGGDGTPVTITQGAGAAPLVNLNSVDLRAGSTYSIVVSGSGSNLVVTARQDNL